MRRSSFVLVSVVVVAAVFLGPLAMALDGCAALGMCDGPCGVTCGAVFAAPALSGLQPIADSLHAPIDMLSTLCSSSLEPPPKLTSLSL